MKELEKILGQELSKQVADKLGNVKVILDNGTLIPKHRFDCINISLKEHKEKVVALNMRVAELNAQKVKYEKIERENMALSGLVLELLAAKNQNLKEETK